MKKRMTCCILTLLLLLLGLPSCKTEDKQTDTFFAMGTSASVTLYGTSEGRAEGATLARSLLAELDGLWSRRIADSDIARLNASPTEITDADDRTVSLVRRAIELSELTDGAFDITLARISELWEHCGEADRLPTDAELSPLLAAVGTAALTADGSRIKKPAAVSLDLGAIAKGETADCLIERLSSVEGLFGGLVSLGSCVAVFGEKPDGTPFRVSIRDPQDRSATVGKLQLAAGRYLSVSGDYERFVMVGGKQYHHIIDPSTGYPSASGLSSVAVIAADGATADALSTALMVMGEERALALYRSGAVAFEAILIRSDGGIVCTDGASLDP